VTETLHRSRKVIQVAPFSPFFVPFLVFPVGATHLPISVFAQPEPGGQATSATRPLLRYNRLKRRRDRQIR
jgi:hypothetical protein